MQRLMRVAVRRRRARGLIIGSSIRERRGVESDALHFNTKEGSSAAILITGMQMRYLRGKRVSSKI